MARSRQIVEEGRPVMAGCPEDPAMTASRHITAGPCVGFLDRAGSEHPLLLD